ncbi:MAG: rod-binding protein [Pirellulaceae bacterium]
MDITSLATTPYDSTTRAQQSTLAKLHNGNAAGEDKELHKAFQDFVGQTFYGQLLSAMRKSVDKPAYLHGGRAEEAFQNQLDQVLAEKLSDASAESFTEPMYQLFSLSRR